MLVDIEARGKPAICILSTPCEWRPSTCGLGLPQLRISRPPSRDPKNVPPGNLGTVHGWTGLFISNTVSNKTTAQRLPHVPKVDLPPLPPCHTPLPSRNPPIVATQIGRLIRLEVGPWACNWAGNFLAKVPSYTCCLSCNSNRPSASSHYGASLASTMHEQVVYSVLKHSLVHIKIIPPFGFTPNAYAFVLNISLNLSEIFNWCLHTRIHSWIPQLQHCGMSMATQCGAKVAAWKT